MPRRSYGSRVKQRAYEWVPRPPTIRERLICGALLAAFALALTNYWAGWQLFRGYDKWVFWGLFLAMVIVADRGPGVRRVESVRRPFSYWLTIGLGLMGGMLLWAFFPRG
jgi:hypothetical protein